MINTACTELVEGAEGEGDAESSGGENNLRHLQSSDSESLSGASVAQWLVVLLSCCLGGNMWSTTFGFLIKILNENATAQIVTGSLTWQ